MTENNRFKSNNRMDCKNFGFDCFKCEHYNHNMTRNKRYIVDDAGTLIDTVTKECYDIVEEVVDVLNEKENSIRHYEEVIDELTSKIIRINRLTTDNELPITQRK